jgi:acetyl-CoA carboxylase carboxyl transferase beta subunit
LISKNLFKKPNNRLEGEQEPQVAQTSRASQASQAPQTVARSAQAEPSATCPGCKATLHRAALARTDYQCPKCGALLQMSARERALWLTDENSFEETDAALEATDRLGFPGYAEKLAKTRRETGEPEGVVTGTATIGGEPCALFCMNPFFIMGSMGAVVGEKITRLFELATERDLPVVGVAVSGGARIQEGMYSLMQMAKTSGAVLRHGEKGLFYVCLLTHPTTGGVVASFAMEADVILAEPRALIGFAGPRVIEQTMRQKLPEGFQRAEFLLKKGFVDRIVPRGEQKRELATLISLNRKEAGA